MFALSLLSLSSRSDVNLSIASKTQRGLNCASSIISSTLPPVLQLLSQSGETQYSDTKRLEIQLCIILRPVLVTIIESDHSTSEIIDSLYSSDCIWNNSQDTADTIFTLCFDEI